jgi:hypothetical protein
MIHRQLARCFRDSQRAEYVSDYTECARCLTEWRTIIGDQEKYMAAGTIEPSPTKEPANEPAPRIRGYRVGFVGNVTWNGRLPERRGRAELPGCSDFFGTCPRILSCNEPRGVFRWLVPTTQLLLLVAIVCNWRPAPGTRWRLGGALALLVLTDMITFRFHYPRNDILFVAPLTQPPAYYDHVVTEWAIGNYVRVALILIAVVLAMVSTIRIARETAPGERRLS